MQISKPPGNEPPVLSPMWSALVGAMVRIQVRGARHENKSPRAAMRQGSQEANGGTSTALDHRA